MDLSPSPSSVFPKSRLSILGTELGEEYGPCCITDTSITCGLRSKGFGQDTRVRRQVTRSRRLRLPAGDEIGRRRIPELNSSKGCLVQGLVMRRATARQHVHPPPERAYRSKYHLEIAYATSIPISGPKFRKWIRACEKALSPSSSFSILLPSDCPLRHARRREGNPTTKMRTNSAIAKALSSSHSSIN